MWQRLKRFLQRARGGTVEHDLSALWPLVAAVREQEASLQGAPADELRTRAATLRERAHREVDLEHLLPETFAVAGAAARIVLGMRPFDVQLLAGVALHRGAVVEMGSGEGKTLAAVPAVALDAWTGRGVHVLTFNDYLARRDATWMGPVYELLGLTVGHVQQGMDRVERRRAYGADVTYGTAKEVGFDLLRDGVCTRPEDLVQRPFHRALVDEADSIMIDEARVPLVIAGGLSPSPLEARRVDALVHGLEPGVDYATGEHGRDAYLTDVGLARTEEQLGCANLYDPAHHALLTQVNLALHARALLHREVDYIVRYGVQQMIPDTKTLDRGDNPIDDPVVAREIARAQRIIEGQHFAIRKVLWQYAHLVEAQRRVLGRRRLEVLHGTPPPGLFRQRSPERHAELVAAVGEDVLAEVERQVTLAILDRHWSQHLVFVADLREGLHLRALGGPVLFYGGPSPLDDFNREISAPFDARMAALDDDVLEILDSAEITAQGIDLAREGLLQTTTTWTFLVQENPFGAWLERFFDDLKKLFTSGDE